MSNNKNGGFIKIGRTLIGIDDSAIMTYAPSLEPTQIPTLVPTASPTTAKPTLSPTHLPTQPTSVVHSINLALLNNNQGFTIKGANAGDYSGYSVAKAGDMNGDGYSDVIVGAYKAASGAGITYVIYGKPTGFANINLTNLTDDQGFTITGANAGDNSGYAVNSAGDFNKDGLADIIIGAPNIGYSYVVFGKINRSSNVLLSNFNLTEGFSIIGDAGAQNGYAVSGAGDLNGDGFDDLVIGSNVWDATVYVIFGKARISNVNLATLSNTQGFSLSHGVNNYGLNYYMGTAVSGAGDVNGDGFADIIIGHNNPYGPTYLILGKANNITNIDLSILNSTQGFAIFGAGGWATGKTVSKAGDINKDGYDDIIIGSTAGGTPGYIIFGKAGNFSTINIGYDDLAVNLGYTIRGANRLYVNKAGDVNGDGYSDIIIGSPYDFNTAGMGYVIFGKAGSNGATLNLESLPKTQGFIITGVNSSDYTGYSVSGAGDFNGDGYDDYIIGAYGANFNAGATYLIFGNKYQTSAPTMIPTVSPTVMPTAIPTKTPTISPTALPTYIPTSAPTAFIPQNVYLSNLSPIQGISVSSAASTGGFGVFQAVGDVDNDTYVDYIFCSQDNNKAWLIYGTVNGIDNNINLNLLPANSNIASVIKGPVGSSFCNAVSEISYVTGVNGFAIGAYGYNNGIGRVYVFKGGSRGDKDVTNSMSSSLGYYVDGSSANQGFGRCIANIGDVDGDGKAEYAVGTNGAGSAFVFYGSNTANIVASFNMQSSQGYYWKFSGQFGMSIVYLGKINNDGANYVAVGSGTSVFIISLANPGNLLTLSSSNGFIISGCGANFGLTVANMGDIKGNGNNALGVGTYGGGGANTVYIFYDITSGISCTSPNVYKLIGPNNNFGFRIAGNLNFDDNNKPDLVVGAFAANKVYLFLDISSSMDISSGVLPIGVYTFTGATSSSTGQFVATINNPKKDGYDGILIGAPQGSSGYLIYGDSFTSSPTILPTFNPTLTPTITPTAIPTLTPTTNPTVTPTVIPTMSPTKAPTIKPTVFPTSEPSGYPSGYPSSHPSSHPSRHPSAIPTAYPTNHPSNEPTSHPTWHPTGGPTCYPSGEPTFYPSGISTCFPSSEPTRIPSVLPTIPPTIRPTELPSVIPTQVPTIQPSAIPTMLPSIKPTVAPTIAPSAIPTMEPTPLPSAIPTLSPTFQPTQNNFGTFPTNEGISVINATSNFKIIIPYMQGISVANNDGFYDITVTAPNYATNYVIFGKDGLSDNINLNNITHTLGFAVPNAISSDNSGRSVDFIGDYNGDGFQDLIIGNPFAKYGTGYAYVIMGDIDGFNKAKYGFTIFGATYGSQLGWSVASAGDFNGDGFNDIVIGSPSYNRPYPYTKTGSSYLIFGKQSGFSNINVASLTLTQGFTIFGAEANDYLGISVSSAGDINNDGFDDVIIGSHSLNNGKTYVIFGRQSNFSNIYLANLDPTQGFLILSADKYDFTGFSVGSCGDINNDGFDDVIVGGVRNSRTGFATSYVIYGKANNFTNIDLATFNRTQGFKITGGGAYVGKAGDVNNDGINDCIVGSGYSEGATSFVIFPAKPSHYPTGMPSGTPTTIPSSAPSVPTSKPTSIPTVTPIAAPTSSPTPKPTAPTGSPTSSPSLKETQAPTLPPTGLPTGIPTQMPLYPTSSPTVADTAPTGIPSSAPSNPTKMPTFTPTAPTLEPSKIPTALPTEHPSLKPTAIPTKRPTKIPTALPILLPSLEPTKSPTFKPTVKPSFEPTLSPTLKPTSTKAPSLGPTLKPTAKPTLGPTSSPTGMPTSGPTNSEQTPYTVITINNGGEYVATPAKEEFIIDSTQDITITSNGGTDKFVVKPHENMQVTITDFDPEIQVIDLQAYKDITKFNQLTITIGSIIINLPNGQKVRLLDLIPEDITQDNFVFAPEHQKNLVIYGLIIGVPSAALIGVVVWLYKTHQEDKQDKQKILSEVQINIVKNTKKASIKIKTNQIQPEESGKDSQASDPDSTTPSNSYDNIKDDNQVNNKKTDEEFYDELSCHLAQLGNIDVDLNSDMSSLELPKNDDDSTITPDSNDHEKYKFSNMIQNINAQERIYNLPEPTSPKIINKKSIELDDISSLSSVEYKEQESNQNNIAEDMLTTNSIELLEGGDNKNDIIPFDIENNNADREGSQNSEVLSSQHTSGNSMMLLCIDNSMNPEIFMLQYEEFAKIAENLRLFIVNDVFALGYKNSNSPNIPELLNNVQESQPATDNIYPAVSNDLTTPILELRRLIEYLPMFKYLGQKTIDVTGTNITLPESLSNKNVLIDTYSDLGYMAASLQPSGNIANALFFATISTDIYAIRTALIDYLHKQKLAIAQDEKINIVQLTDYCGYAMLTYTVPSISNCATLKLLYPEINCGLTTALTISASMGGAECYNAYKATTQEAYTPTVADVVIPYIADSISLILASKNLNLGLSDRHQLASSIMQTMRVASAILATDYISRTALDMVPREIKENYIEPVFTEVKEIYEDCIDTANRMIGEIEGFKIEDFDYA